MFDLSGRKIWVAGHRGMVGSALVRRLAQDGHAVLTTGEKRLDMIRQADVETFFAANRPDVVIIAAAKVGQCGAAGGFPPR